MLERACVGGGQSTNETTTQTFAKHAVLNGSHDFMFYSIMLLCVYWHIGECRALLIACQNADDLCMIYIADNFGILRSLNSLGISNLCQYWYCDEFFRGLLLID